jgi:hypothetical protein
MKAFGLFSVVLALSLSAQAWIPTTRQILNKTTDNSGSGIYAIEQEVQFPNGAETLNLKETWLIDSDRTMRLTVTGTKEQASTIKLQFLYQGGQRHRLVDGTRRTEKISDDFLEKYLNFRSSDVMANVLTHMKIIPSNAMVRRGGAKGADFKNAPEDWVRFSRTGGVVNYAFGTPTPVDQSDSNPGLWIEQDQFVVRKVRLPSQAEMTADNYSGYSKGLRYPKSRTIRWDKNTASIRLISASPRPQSAAGLLQPNSLDVSQKVDGLADMAAKDAVIEFYSRFR